MKAGALQRAILSIAMAATMLWTVHTIYDGLSQTARVERAIGIPFLVWLSAMLLVAALQAWAIVALWRQHLGSQYAIRWGFVVAVMFWLLYLTLGQPLDLYELQTALSATSGIFATALLLSPRLTQLANHPGIRKTQIILFNLCLTALLMELALGTLAWVSPRPELIGRDSYVQSRLATYAFPPGFVHRGFACNSTGHYDHEFLPKDQRTKPTVLMIGDSFSASVVPHHYHFTTVAERKLNDIEVYNMGLSGIGPEEYLYLLSHEGLRLQPEAVILNLFIGNDLTNTRTGTGIAQFLNQWFDRGNVRIWFLPERLMVIAAERNRAQPKVFGKEPQKILNSDKETLGAYPWIEDYRLEKPSLSTERYLEVIHSQIRSSCPPHPDRLKPLLAHIAKMKSLCGDTPFGVMLIPAEYQLEDALWETATAQFRDGPRPRQAAQLAVRQWLKTAGIPCLDLLPPLQAAKPFADGNRHCYLSRDTHFNARGNRITGEALGPFIRDLMR
jgi:hypothetical protein